MISGKLPLISCVCVTKDRFELFKKSIFCYLNQNYQNKNLIILSQSNDDTNKKIEKYIKDLSRDDILFLAAPTMLTLGAMRNTSIELATGEIICQWDDDDLYHPNRLTNQYKCLKSDNRNVASLYSNFLKYFANSKEVYWCDWLNESEYSHRFLCGSVMFYKSLFHMWENFYPERGAQSCCEEDLNVLEKLMLKGSIAPVLDGNEYVYVYHGVNTYDLDHHKLTLDIRWGKKVYTKEDLLKKQNLIEETFDLIQMDDIVKIKSLGEVAFTYTI
jgi:glycosyltransferase involved in cell wall biosynthesis